VCPAELSEHSDPEKATYHKRHRQRLEYQRPYDAARRKIRAKEINNRDPFAFPIVLPHGKDRGTLVQKWRHARNQVSRSTQRAGELSPDSGRKTGIGAQSDQLQDSPDKLVRINGFGQVCLEAGQSGPNPIFLTSCGCKSNHRQLSDVWL
jgi:hypothetical protein